MNKSEKNVVGVVVLLALFFTGFMFAKAAGCTPFLVASGGTGKCTFSSGGMLFGNGTSAVGATSSPTVGWITGTSTATSTFQGGINANILYTSSTTASSTFSTGLNLLTGCIAYNGTCVTQNAGTVTSVAASVPSLLSIAGSPITTNGTLAFTYSGTALPIANGGTATTTQVTGSIWYFNGTTQTSTTTFNIQTSGNVGVGTSTPWALLSVNGNTLGSTPQFVVGSSTGTNLIVTSGGLTGIGTTSPNNALTLDRNSGSVATSSILVYPYTPATSTSMTVDCKDSNTLHMSIGTAGVTFTLKAMTAGQTCKVIVSNPGGTAGTITWTAASGQPIYWVGGTAPVQTTTGFKRDVYSFIADVIASTATSTPGVSILGASSLNF